MARAEHENTLECASKVLWFAICIPRCRPSCVPNDRVYVFIVYSLLSVRHSYDMLVSCVLFVYSYFAYFHIRSLVRSGWFRNNLRISLSHPRPSTPFPIPLSCCVAWCMISQSATIAVCVALLAVISVLLFVSLFTLSSRQYCDASLFFGSLLFLRVARMQPFTHTHAHTGKHGRVCAPHR